MIDTKYAAGFFDGEGCVSIHYDKRCDSYVLKTSVSNTVREVLEAFKSRWNGAIHDNKPKKPHHSGWSSWELQGSNCRPFLEDIRPYTLIKTPQIDLAFELLSTYGRAPGRGHKLSEEVKAKRCILKEKMHSFKTKGHGLRGAQKWSNI